jgi:transposase
MDRAAAAKIGGMDRQTLRDWVHRFNALGPEGLIDNRTEGPKPRLSEEQLAQFAKIVEAGPDREKDGIVRWRHRTRPVALKASNGQQGFARG